MSGKGRIIECNIARLGGLAGLSNVRESLTGDEMLLQKGSSNDIINIHRAVHHSKIYTLN